jgi:hypothetical protein
MAAGIRDWRIGHIRADKTSVANILVGALFVLSASTKLAEAHISGHEEWNDVLSASKNQYNGQCCGLGDSHLVEFGDWQQTIDGNYAVYLLGQWRRIEPTPCRSAARPCRSDRPSYSPVDNIGDTGCSEE